MAATVAVRSRLLRITPRYRVTLEESGLAQFDEVMATQGGRCLRVLSDRENWYLPGNRQTPSAAGPEAEAADSLRSRRLLADGRGTVPAVLGMYLKKHRAHTWTSRIAAILGAATPSSPGRVEGENALVLQSLGIDVMPLMAYGEKLHADGRLESFLLTEELGGYCELQDFIQRRFPTREKRSVQATADNKGEPTLADPLRGYPGTLVPPYGFLLTARSSSLPPDPALRRLIIQVADIARRFHAAGFNHRDFYCCHFLVKETSPGRCDVRLIDLQRVQKRRWFRRRWIVKDLAQLASMSPDDRVGCREKILFLRTYLGVRKLRPQDKRLVRDVLWKLALIRRRTRSKP